MSEWVLSWGEHTWSSEDLTAQHLVLIVQGLGADTWDFAPTKGPVKLLAVLAAFISVATNEPLPLVMVALSTVKAADLLDGLQIVEG